MRKWNAQDSFSQEIEVAERAAKEAGSIIMGLYGSHYRIEQKGKGNPVTTADLEANHKIREIILGKFPEDGWLSEEDKDNLRRLDFSRVWVVDPIDGTKEFIEGVPQFAVSVGLVVDGRPKLGVVYNPAVGELYRALEGYGATLNGRPIRVSSCSEVSGARLLVSRSEPKGKFESFANLCRLEPIGSIAFRLAKVACGEGDGTLTFRALHEWDFCAGAIVVEEAGGYMTDGRGERIVFNREETRHRGLVAANQTLGPALQSMLAALLFDKKANSQTGRLR